MQQSASATQPIKPKHYKSAIKPVWCPGCGHYAVLSAITKALAHLALANEVLEREARI